MNCFNLLNYELGYLISKIFKLCFVKLSLEAFTLNHTSDNLFDATSKCSRWCSLKSIFDIASKLSI